MARVEIVAVYWCSYPVRWGRREFVGPGCVRTSSLLRWDVEAALQWAVSREVSAGLESETGDAKKLVKISISRYLKGSFEVERGEV